MCKIRAGVSAEVITAGVRRDSEGVMWKVKVGECGGSEQG